ncbi:MAG: RDD family protein [Polyangiales bacterium]
MGQAPPAGRTEVLPLDTLVEIETPEHIVFRHRVAGPARRMVAHVLDLIICYGAVVVIALIVVLATASGAAASSKDPDDVGGGLKAGLGVILVVLFVAQWGYFFVFEAFSGRTPGKRALGLRVLTTQGRPIGVAAAALRNLVRAADALPVGYLLGVLVMTMSDRFQRLGDLVAGTLVVVERSGLRVARPLVLSPPLRPHEMGALPEVVTLDAEERVALELFLRRRDTLGPAREHELARMIVEPLAKRFDVRAPPGAIDPPRLLALLYHRALEGGRGEAPVSSRARGAVR